MDGEIEKFVLSVPETDLMDLRRRLRSTRWPKFFGGESWTYGARLDSLIAIQDFWANEYDWRAVEVRLNRYPQYLTEIDGLRIHFFHVPAKSGSGRPLLLLHGWPGSQVEFLDMIDDFVDPIPSGHNSDEAFDLVIPAIPGFGFGQKPKGPGWGPDRIADAFHQLMSRLDYHRYGVQGGDWGAIIGRRIAQRHAGAIVGLHINMPYAYPPDAAEIPECYKAFRKTGTGYLALQSTRPDAIAVALADSPMGLATWILEKFAAWTDGEGDLPPSIPLETLVTNIMFYWLPNSAGSAARIYYESASEAVKPFGGAPVTVPTAIASFSAEPYSAPRTWVESIYNVVRWREFPAGGHFAALEQREVLREDVYAFFKNERFERHCQSNCT